MDRLEAMRILLRVAERGSFSAASRDLGVPLATVSRKVNELETHLGARLLVRTTRKVALTDTGERLTVSPVLDAFISVRVPGHVKTITLSYRPAWRERSLFVFAVSLIVLLSALLGVALYGRRAAAR